MPAPLLKLETRNRLPPQVDVAIIGGGIVGTTAAYFLARRGLSVALLEKGYIGAEQSSRNWGWCRQQNRDARELPMATRALELWDRLSTEIGEDTGFRRCGLLYLSNSEAEIEGWANWSEFARTRDVISHVLTAEQACQRGAATGSAWRGGVFSQSDGIADPVRAVPVIAGGVLKAGGHVIQQCAVRGVLTEAGRVSGVVTELGEMRCSQVVMAGGAWASSFCHQLGVTFPQASVRASIMSVDTQRAAVDWPDALHTKSVSVTRRGEHSYTLAISGRARVDPTPQQLRFAADFLPMFASRWRTLSPGGLQAARAGHETRKKWSLDAITPMERLRVLDPVPDRSTLRATLSRARQLLPALRHAQVQAEWASFIDSTPDGVPVIDASATLPGFVLAAGFSGHGFGIGPGAGHLVADLVTGADPIVDPSQYRLSRLTASSRGKVADF